MITETFGNTNRIQYFGNLIHVADLQSNTNIYESPEIDDVLDAKIIGNIGNSSLPPNYEENRAEVSTTNPTNFYKLIASRIAQWKGTKNTCRNRFSNSSIDTLLEVFTDLTQQPKYEEFSKKLLSFFKENAVEDGEYHQAEDVILQILQENEINGWSLIQKFFYENFDKRPAISADFLQCVSRLPNQYFDIRMLTLAISGLKNKDVGVRESGIRILESYKTQDAITILRNHKKDEPVKWLKEYAEQVIIDLT